MPPPPPDNPERAWDEARALLGVAAEADEAEIRRAYLEKVRQHPPDRDPDRFERIRDAYDRLRDPRLRARHVLASPDPATILTGLLGPETAPRKLVGPAPWVAVLKEKRS